jgi:hypothetical protein
MRTTRHTVRCCRALPTRPNSTQLRVHHLVVRISTYNRDVMAHCTRYVRYFPQHASRLAYAPHPHADFMKEYPQYIAPKNAMGFLSDNGGADYNLCHCTSSHCAPRMSAGASGSLIPFHAPNATQFGATLRLPIWTFGAARPTRRFSSTSRVVAVSTTRYVPPHQK